MFDDLHDPAPPTAGLDTLARVSARAKAIRRRRVALASGASVAVVALVAAAVVLPGRDRSTIAPAETVATSLPESTDAAGNRCDALVAPVWLPNGEVPGVPEPQSGIDPFSGDRVEGRNWLSPEGFGLLVQLPGGSDVFDLPPSGQTWDLRVRDARPNADSVEVTIWRRADRCVARYLVPGDVEAATAWGATLVDMLTAATAEGPISTDADGCVIVLGRRFSCVSGGSIPSGPMLGPIAATFTRLLPSDASDPPILRGGLGVLQVVVGAGDTISPRSRLSVETPIDGTDVKRVVDLVPLGDRWCGSTRRGDGSVALFEVADSSNYSPSTATSGHTCTPTGESEATPTDASSTTTGPTTSLSLSTTPGGVGQLPAAGDAPVVAIDANGDAVVFREPSVPSAVRDGTQPPAVDVTPGPAALIDGVAATIDGSSAFVGVCCEPSAGALWRHDPNGGEGAFVTYGHLPALTSFGNLVWYSFGPVNVGGLDGSIASTILDLDPNEWTVTDLAVVQRGNEPEEVLVLASRADGTFLWRVFVGGGDMQLSQKISDAVAPSAQLTLAGFAADQYRVLNRRTGLVEYYDARTLQPVPTDSSPVDWISAWITPMSDRHVDADGVLWVDGASWGAGYRWVR